jgi:hypothetical protein
VTKVSWTKYTGLQLREWPVEDDSGLGWETILETSGTPTRFLLTLKIMNRRQHMIVCTRLLVGDTKLKDGDWVLDGI